MSSPLVKVTDLSKDYGHGAVFSDVSFDLFPGETAGLFGPSGSGKSTLGRCITRLEEPGSGAIQFMGQDLMALKRTALRRLRPKLQMIFQHPETSLNPRMTLIESITEPLRLVQGYSTDQAIDSISPLLSEVGLRYEQLQRYPHQLSGGEIQRAVIAKVFSMEPAMVIADEATSMLDVSVQAQVLRLMEKLQKKTNVAYLIISHDMQILEAVCDRIFIMENNSVRVA